MVEDMELKMRNLLRKFIKFLLYSYTNSPEEEVYFGKAKDVVGDLRSKPRTRSFSKLHVDMC